MSLYEKIVTFVDATFGGKKPHFERTVFWIEKFLPTATEAHRIAAYAHDIERGVNGEKDRDYLNPEFIRKHEEEGARITGEFITAKGADPISVGLVKRLTSRHEEGGDDEQNALMDADSVSYFETNAQMFVRDRVKEDGYAKVKGKLDWMFNRISTQERKAYARANYEKWSKELEKLNQ